MTTRQPQRNDQGWIVRRFKKIEKQLRESNAARRLESATIGRGGVKVKGGGSVTVEDGGRIKVLYDSGRTAAEFGALPAEGEEGSGLRILMDQEVGPSTGLGNALLEVFTLPDSPTFPGGLRITRFLNSDFFTAASEEGAIVQGGGSYFLATSTGGVDIVAETGGMWLDGGSEGVQIQHGTTAAAANVYIDPTTGRLWRVSSSRRYKRDESALDVDVGTVLALVPRRFRDRREVEELGDEAPWRVGFIAEEAAELGLDDWVTSDDEGPESFSYPSWPVAQQAVIRRQQQQIDDLTDLAADLTARIERLETAKGSA